MEKQEPSNQKNSLNFFGLLLIVLLLILIVVLQKSQSQKKTTLTSAQTANTLLVPQNYQTIQSAINAAAAGDIILISSGTYRENLNIDRAVTLSAASYDKINPRNNGVVIDGGGQTVIMIPKAVPSQINLVGLTIKNGGLDGIQSFSPFLIEYSYLTQAADLIDYSKGSGGINRFNVFDGGTDDDLDLDNAINDFLIENNQILNAKQDGIEIRLQDDVIASQAAITIRNNLISGSGQDGIQFIDYATDTNRLFKIERNLIEKSKKAAIGLMDNQITSEDYRAASIKEPMNVINNTIVNNDYGISGGDNMIVVNNIIANNTGLGIKNIDGGSTVAYNLFWANGTNYSGSNLNGSTNNIGDPLLTPDFHLGIGSPAIDAGIANFSFAGRTALALTSADFIGQAPDLGSYEGASSPILSPTVNQSTPTVSPAISQPAPTATPISATRAPACTYI